MYGEASFTGELWILVKLDLVQKRFWFSIGETRIGAEQSDST